MSAPLLELGLLWFDLGTWGNTQGAVQTQTTVEDTCRHTVDSRCYRVGYNVCPRVWMAQAASQPHHSPQMCVGGTATEKLQYLNDWQSESKQREKRALCTEASFPLHCIQLTRTRGNWSQARKTRLMPRGGDSRASDKVLHLSLDLSQVCTFS